MSRARGLVGPGPGPSTAGARYSELIRGVLRPHVPPAVLEVVVADVLAILVEASYAQPAAPGRVTVVPVDALAAHLGSSHEAWAAT